MNEKAFYDHVRSKMGSLTQDQVDGFKAVLKAISGLPLSHQAYMLATAWHETAGTMQPRREMGGRDYFTRMYDVRGERPELARKHGNIRAGDGVLYCGRGYVQITWFVNYERADHELAEAGLINRGELLRNPDRAMEPKLAAFILVRGMTEGWFTGKKLADYLPLKGVAKREQYIQARRIINILDRADLVEDYAQIFEKALRLSGMS